MYIATYIPSRDRNIPCMYNNSLQPLITQLKPDVLAQGEEPNEMTSPLLQATFVPNPLTTLTHEH